MSLPIAAHLSHLRIRTMFPVSLSFGISLFPWRPVQVMSSPTAPDLLPPRILTICLQSPSFNTNLFPTQRRRVIGLQEVGMPYFSQARDQRLQSSSMTPYTILRSQAIGHRGPVQRPCPTTTIARPQLSLIMSPFRIRPRPATFYLVTSQ